MKILFCSKCKTNKSEIEFHRGKNRDGRNAYCKQCCSEYKREYYQKHREEILANVKKNSQIHKTKKLKYAKEYFLNHKAERLRYAKEYQSNHKTEKLQYDKKYRITTQGKTVRRRAQNKRRRNLEYNPLNKEFHNSVGHHVNNKDVVFIPLDIHKRFNNYYTQKHRDLILQYYGNIENMIINKPFLL